MKPHRTILPAAVAVAIAALLSAGGCSNNTQGDDASPVFFTIDFTQLPLSKNVADGAFLQFATVTVRSVLKVPGTTSTQFLDARVDDYTVDWSRVDGGKTASPSEVFPGNVVVPAGGISTWNNYPFMTSTSLNKPPLDQLFPYNGGVDRETGNTLIRQRGKVTLRGHTMSGQPVSGFNTFDMNFFYSATARKVQVSVRPSGR